MLEAEEIAAIVPVPEAVLDDSAIDLWAEIREGLAEAVGQALDAAVFAARQARVVAAGDRAGGHRGRQPQRRRQPAEEGGIVNDIAETFDDVEEDGYDVTGIVAARGCAACCARRATPPGSAWWTSRPARAWTPRSPTWGPAVLPADVLAVVGDFTMAVLGSGRTSA